MGGFDPLTAGIAITGMIAQREQAGAAAKAQAQQAEVQNRALWQQQEQRTRQQKDLLKRQLASSRAALAAGGVGFAGGSGQALMQGMARNAQEGIADSFANASLQQEAMSAGQRRPTAAEGIHQGLQTISQGLQILKPLF
ncbi:MAG: hypothetical protein AB1918_02320 [Pseudomonadota bacterium]